MAKSVRDDKGKPVSGYFEKFPDWRGEVMNAIDAVVRTTVPEVEGSIKWGQAVYKSGGPFAYIKGNKNNVNFGFWWGAFLSDPDGKLQGTGEKMRHFKLNKPADLDQDQFAAWIREAIALNETKGDPTQNK